MILLACASVSVASLCGVVKDWKWDAYVDLSDTILNPIFNSIPPLLRRCIWMVMAALFGWIAIGVANSIIRDLAIH